MSAVDRRRALGAMAWLAVAGPVAALAQTSRPARSRRSVSQKVPGDRAIEVALGPVDSPRAIAYLHGQCGDPLAFQSWEAAATAHATLISLRGDLSCKKRKGRSEWSYNLDRHVRRIDKGLDVANELRWTAVDSVSVTDIDKSHVLLIGYSQGAHRVQSLVHHAPKRFPRVAIIAPAKMPDVAKLQQAERILLMAGERDAKKHIQEGRDALNKAGATVLYLELPGARHGEYGPEAERVMAQGLEWLYK
jgi:predicted esterase